MVQERRRFCPFAYISSLDSPGLWGRRHFHHGAHRLAASQRLAFIDEYCHVTFESYKKSLWERSMCYLKTGSDDSSTSYLIHEEVAGLQVIWPPWLQTRTVPFIALSLSCVKMTKIELFFLGSVCSARTYPCPCVSFSCAISRKSKIKQRHRRGVCESV